MGVILEATDKEVRLIIEDDGKGFIWEGDDTSPEASPSGSHRGLFSICPSRELKWPDFIPSKPNNSEILRKIARNANFTPAVFEL